ncbi:MAG TPA: hypothetical protein VG713_18080 [Pirellulales bacterium]|nr:hypothetical protein [Pirellulales bacterium]
MTLEEQAEGMPMARRRLPPPETIFAFAEAFKGELKNPEPQQHREDDRQASVPAIEVESEAMAKEPPGRSRVKKGEQP